MGHFAVVLLLAPLVLSAAPRLLLTPAKVTELRQRIRVPASPQAAMFAQLQAQVDQPPASGAYALGYRATAAAFLYQLTAEPRHCAVALSSLRQVYADPAPTALTAEQGYGLARATVGTAFAYAYDWCGEAWTPDERAWIHARLTAALDAWPAFRHANLEAPHRGSNWVAVCRGGELVEMIALGQEQARPVRYALLKEDLRRHMRNMDEIGVTQEGVGYLGYGGIFLLRALLALRTIGDADLEPEAQSHAWWQQALYSGSFVVANDARVWLGSGVSGDGIGDEGWASLLFAFTPPAHRPHFLWWYNRHMGALSPSQRRWDPRREGPVWALLCYPAALTEADPTGVLPPAITGRAGLVLFRNRWRDHNDILLSIHADRDWHTHAWDQPEALQLRVLAYGASLLTGPDKSRQAARFSTLLVDGQHVAPTARATTGEARQFTLHPHGADVIVAGGSQYASLGVDVVRHLKVRFHSGNRATLSLEDRINSPQPHKYTWQFVPGPAIVPLAQFRLQAPGGQLSARIPTATRLLPDAPLRLERAGSNLVFRLDIQLRPQRP